MDFRGKSPPWSRFPRISRMKSRAEAGVRRQKGGGGARGRIEEQRQKKRR